MTLTETQQSLQHILAHWFHDHNAEIHQLQVVAYGKCHYCDALTDLEKYMEANK